MGVVGAEVEIRRVAKERTNMTFFLNIFIAESNKKTKVLQPVRFNCSLYNPMRINKPHEIIYVIFGVANMELVQCYYMYIYLEKCKMTHKI